MTAGVLPQIPIVEEMRADFDTSDHEADIAGHESMGFLVPLRAFEGGMLARLVLK